MSNLSMPVVWTDRHRLHEPKGEVWLGVWIEGTEVPARGDRIRAALEDAHASLVEPASYDEAPFEAVHDPALLSFLETAYDEWAAGGYLEEPGQDRVVPYVFPLPQLTPGRAPHWPASMSARTGMSAMDTMTLIGPGTWEAARAVAEAALTAADLVAGGVPAAYAMCRPPGHHVGRDFYGGSCYLNNAAIAAQRMRSGGIPRVGIVDLDAHHGNGTQEIFYQRSEWYMARSTSTQAPDGSPTSPATTTRLGSGRSRGNLNLPLPPGTAMPSGCGGRPVDRFRHGPPGGCAGGVVGRRCGPGRPGEPVAGHRRGLCGSRADDRRARVAHRVRPGRRDHLDSLGGLVLATLLAFEGEKRERHD